MVEWDVCSMKSLISLSYFSIEILRLNRHRVEFKPLIAYLNFASATLVFVRPKCFSPGTRLNIFRLIKLPILYISLFSNYNVLLIVSLSP